MNTTGRSWLIFGNWLGSVLALMAAAVHGASGVASAWALGAAVLVTVAVMGWPSRGFARLVAIGGLVWQAALIATYWPFAATQFTLGSIAPAQWPLSALITLGILTLLALSFLVMFLVPAIGLRLALGRARAPVVARQPDALERVAKAFEGDDALRHLWLQYCGQLRTLTDSARSQSIHSISSARDVFDLHTLTHSRLRLDLFRNLPGILTGLGIVGTFMGIIKGIRGLQFSQDPSEIQRVFDTLSVGVAEAFVVSMTAITLSMAVTLVEKTVMSSIAHALDAMNVGLDAMHPPRPGDELLTTSPHPSQQAAPAFMAAPLSGPGPAPGPVSVAAAPPAPAPERPAADAAQSAELLAQLLAVSTQVQGATKAMAELARALPETIAEQSRLASQGNQQTAQALRGLSSRLEGVASTIEVSGRRTLETVAARLMQAEMQMVSRNQSVAEHLGELVQRIETLCSLLQQDRFPMDPGMGSLSAPGASPHFGSPGSMAQAGAGLGSSYGGGGDPNGRSPYGSATGAAFGADMDRGGRRNNRPLGGGAPETDDEWADWGAPAERKLSDRSFGS
jgi:hypothetical protein